MLSLLYGPLSHPYMTTEKNIALTIWTFVGKVMSLLFNILPRFVIVFLPSSKHLLTSWIQSLSVVILEPKKIKSCVTVSTFSPSNCYEMMGLDAMILIFAFWVLNQLFQSLLSQSPRGFSVPLFSAIRVISSVYLIGCWYFFQQSWLQLVIHPVWYFTWCTLNIS